MAYEVQGSALETCRTEGVFQDLLDRAEESAIRQLAAQLRDGAMGCAVAGDQDGFAVARSLGDLRYLGLLYPVHRGALCSCMSQPLCSTVKSRQVGFFYVHRLFHNPKFYTRFHKKHHVWLSLGL